jgi:hypothetical protein
MMARLPGHQSPAPRLSLWTRSAAHRHVSLLPRAPAAATRAAAHDWNTATTSSPPDVQARRRASEVAGRQRRALSGRDNELQSDVAVAQAAASCSALSVTPGALVCRSGSGGGNSTPLVGSWVRSRYAGTLMGGVKGHVDRWR